MAFKLPEKKPARPDDLEALFRDLRKKTVPGLLSHQVDVLRSYMAVHAKHSDIALQLPTRSGKTLAGLLIARSAIIAMVASVHYPILPDGGFPYLRRAGA
jgi:superfamily II DNA or RNA helicase